MTAPTIAPMIEESIQTIRLMHRMAANDGNAVMAEELNNIWNCLVLSFRKTSAAIATAESALTAERARTAKLEAILKEANNMLAESRSGFISGSRSDLDWQASRDLFVEEIRAALSPADGGKDQEQPL